MASPFAFQLGTNHCPSDEEVLKIRAHLVQPIRRLKRLDDEIADLQRAIDKLADERETLGVYVEAHKSLISPVRRLPLDIIQEIFMACLPTHRNCVMSASEAPVLLGRICSAWRAISLSTPPLWASLHIVEPMHSSGSEEPSTLIKEKMEQRLETTKAWLGRSGQCPLSISLESCPDNAFDDRRRPHPGYFLRALIPFASRWQHISFTAQPTSLNAMSRLAETDVPMLESVAIYHHSSRNVKLENFGMLRSSRISSFSISGLNFRESLPLRWHQLTVLEITDLWGATSITSEMILRTLSRCPELRTCKLGANDLNETGSPHPIVELPFLHTLEFQCQTGDFTCLLDRLSLPELHHFTLNGRPGTRDYPSLAHLFNFWTRLESLDIASYTFSKSSLLDSLRNLPPTIKRLKIRDAPHSLDLVVACLDDDVLAALTPAAEPTAPCYPALETLLIESCSLISDLALLHFITARMTGRFRPTLRRVDIRFNRKMTLDIRPNLQPFIDVGLDVSTTHIQPFKVLSPWQGLSDAPDRPIMPPLASYW